MMYSYERWMRDWQGCLAAAFFNYEMDRTWWVTRRITRKPGFTEVWQADDNDTWVIDTSTTDHVPEQVWLPPEPNQNQLADDDDNNNKNHTSPTSTLTTSTTTKKRLILYQHEPAWAEQLVLRVSGLPHTVVNVSYASMEATGPLPALLVPGTVEHPEPVLVGRHALRLAQKQEHDTKTNNLNTTSSSSLSSSSQTLHEYETNAILEEALPRLRHKRLQLHHLVKVPAPHHDLVDPIHGPDPNVPYLFHHVLLQSVLPNCLTVLRYHDDQAWYSWNRYRSLASYRGHDTIQPATLFSWKPWAGLFQTWCERQFSWHSLPRSCRHWTTAEALQHVEHAYRLLERQLEVTANLAAHQPNTNKRTDMETPHPRPPTYLLPESPHSLTLTDALLWQHLQHAARDVHLVHVLPKYPHLQQFARHVSQHDFYRVHREQDNELWRMNDAVNATNVWGKTSFSHNETAHANINTNKSRGLGFQDDNTVDEPSHLAQALQLMQTTALKNGPPPTTSREVPTTTTTKESPPPFAEPRPTTPRATPPEADAATREHQRGDELWLAGTLVATVGALGYAYFMSSSNNSNNNNSKRTVGG